MLQNEINNATSLVVGNSTGEAIYMSKKGKIRYNKKIDRYFVDLYWQGTRHHVYKYMGRMPCATKGMADILLRDLRSEIDKGIFRPERYKKRRPLHLAEYSEEWLKTIVVSKGTLHDYNNSLKNHILPVLGREFLPDINYYKLRKFQTGIKRALKGKHNVMGCLHKLLQDACDSGYISQMPKFPGFKGSEAIVPPRIDWISEPDQWKIINHMPPEDRYIFIFMKLTGCRPSEARAFRWCDIAEDHILFEKTFGRGGELKEVKQKKIRTFPRTEALNELLDQIPRKDLTFVFINPRTGKHYHQHLFKFWNKACKLAGVKKIKLYNSMRHSFGCQMLNAGLHKSVVQRLLGHSNPKMTDRYAEYSTSSLKLALDNIVQMPKNLSVPKK
jgi:integrase